MLQSIEHQSGLPIAFDPATDTIHWSSAVRPGQTSVRTFGEMRAYLREPDARPSQDALYTVYRRVARVADTERIKAANLRYDITVIPPGRFVGARSEFFRTAGHYHAVPPDRPVAPPEVFEVISGRAYWLIQRPARPTRPAEAPARRAGGPEAGTTAAPALEEVYLVEAGPGEKAIMPPGFGHISINARPEPLVLANWISNACIYDYEPYRRFRGGGYRVIEGTVSDTIEFERNPRYGGMPELAKLRPREVPAFGLIRAQPLYALAGKLGQLAFLNDPESFADLLTVDNCYRVVV